MRLQLFCVYGVGTALIYDDEGSRTRFVNHQVDVTSCVVTHGDFRVEYYACQLQLGRPIEQKFF